MPLHRLFVAIELPEAVKDALAALCGDVPGAKWVPRPQMHLTLRFIGEVQTPVFAAVRGALAQIEAAAFPLALRGVGQFPPNRPARVLWVGLEAPSALLSLQRRIEAAVTGCGLPPEDKPFSPHITLARLKNPAPPPVVRAFLDQRAAFAAGPFPVEAFALFSSVLAASGPTYTRELLLPLRTV